MRLTSFSTSLKRIPILFLLIVCAYASVAQTPSVEITTRNDSDREKSTAAALTRVVGKYDLSKWIFTNKVIIEQRVIPHSHPVLTLNTQDPDDTTLMSSFIHEQLHWYIDKYPGKVKKAVDEFRKRYKDVPYANRAGAQDEYSTYVHLALCYLEYRSMASLVGEDEAKQQMWNKPYYTWVYNKIIEDRDAIGKIVADAGFDLVK